MRVTFSEPVVDADRAANKENYSITAPGGSIAPNAANVVAGSNNRQYELTLNNNLTVGVEYTAQIGILTTAQHRIQDYAGYNLQPIAIKFNLEQDTRVPSVENVTFVDQTTVNVSFNKPVDINAMVAATNFYWNNTGVEGFRQYTATNVARINDTNVRVTFGANNYLREGTAYVFTTGVRDLQGNTMIGTAKNEITVVDSGAITATVASQNDRTITVTFNREVTAATVTAANFVVKNSQGQTMSYNGGPTRGGVNNNVVTMTYTNALPAGTYTVEVKNVKDNLGKTIADTTLSVTVKDTTPIGATPGGSGLISIVAIDNAQIGGVTRDRIVVTYPEDMTTTGTNGIGTKARYEIDTGSGSGYVALAGTATVNVLDAKRAEIILADNTFNTNSTVNVRVNLVADAAGNMNPAPVSPQAGITPVAAAETNINISNITPQITALNKITMTLPRHLQSAVSSDFIIVADNATTIAVQTAEYTNNLNGTSTLTLTLSGNMNLAQRTYQVRTTDVNGFVTGTRDILGSLLVGNVTSQIAQNAIVPSVSKFSVTNANVITVEFDKSMVMVQATDFRLALPNGTVVIPTKAEGSANVWTLTFADNTFTADTDANLKLYTIASPASEDAFSNKLTAITAANALQATNFRIASLSITRGARDYNIDGDETIVITFTEPINPASIVANWDGSERVVLKANGFAGDGVVFAKDANTITLPNIGVATVNEQDGLISADSTLNAATYRVNGNQLIVKLVGLDTALTNKDQIAPNSKATLTLNPNATPPNFRSTTNTRFNANVTAVASPRFALPQLTATFDAANDQIKVVTNYGVAVATDNDAFDISNAKTTAVNVSNNALTLKTSHNAADIPVTGGSIETLTAKGNADTGALVLAGTTNANVTKITATTVTFTISDAANGTSAQVQVKLSKTAENDNKIQFEAP